MDSKKIKSAYRALLKAAKNSISQEDIPRIRAALDLSIKTGDGCVTLTGESQVLHTLSVARIIAAEMGLGPTSIITALLHDSYDKLDLNSPELEKQFGHKVTGILKGFSRISSLESMQSGFQAENFRKLLLSLADDVRVILIKLVERLEYMRNLEKAREKDRLPVASETYFLYAPLAHRLGFYNIKSEMEDLAIKFLEPEKYDYIVSRLRQTTASRNRFIKEFSQPLQEKLQKLDFQFSIKSRTKSIHSILMKMKKQEVEFEEVYDLFAVRIILRSEPENEKSDCWRAYSVVTDLYQPNPSRLRDWLSVPKSNGYESLHTTVIGPRGRWVEVQIRSERMDEIAEKGLAAHFRYKGVKAEGGLDVWLNRMREILESPEKEDTAFFDQIRSGLYTDEVFVFTPKGDLRQLPAGATLLDFAFDIHTEVGSTCVGGKVNGKNVTLRYALQNGDHVNILRSKNQKPKQDWLSFVVTSKAKSKIRLALNAEKTRTAAEGKEILMRRLKNWKMNYNDTVIQQLINHYNFRTAQDFYNFIAEGKIELLEIKEVLQGGEPVAPAPHDPVTSLKEPKEDPDTLYSDFLVIEDKVEGLDYKLAKCCRPVFGDPVFGFVTISEGIKIHRKGCPNAHNLMTRYPYRIVAAQWTKTERLTSFITTIKITGFVNTGIVNQISEAVSLYNVTIRSFSYSSEKGMFEGNLGILVPNNDVLYSIIKKIQALKGIHRVIRQTD